MAQSQAQPNATSSETGRNMPATQARSGQLVSRDLPMWSASPFGLMRRLSEDMDQLFGQLAGGNGALLAGPTLRDTQPQWIPAIDVSQHEDKLVVQADLPGLGADDVTVEVDNGILTLSGERRDERETESDGVRRTERLYGRFSRSIVLPDNARADEVQASFRDGVLEITVPLSKSASPPRRVDIQGAARGENKPSDGK